MGSENGNSDTKDLWFQEIIRETEHYYQSELQQDQRASWILASICVLLALIGTIHFQTEYEFRFPFRLFVLMYSSFFLSGVFSIFTILPKRGDGYWIDGFIRSYRRYKDMEAEKLVKRRFHHGKKWSRKDYEERLFHHYKAHLLRAHMKEFGVIWSAIFMLVGFISLGAIVLINLF